MKHKIYETTDCAEIARICRETPGDVIVIGLLSTLRDIVIGMLPATRASWNGSGWVAYTPSGRAIFVSCADSAIGYRGTCVLAGSNPSDEARARARMLAA